MISKKAITIILGFLFLFTGSFAQVAKLLPVNELNKDKSLNDFMVAFLRAVNNNDTSFLFNNLYEDMYNGHHEQPGIEVFKKVWKLDVNQILGKEIIKAVVLGGVMVEKNRFEMPYTSALFPSDKFNVYNHGIVIKNSAFVYEQPTISSPRAGALSFEIVEVTNWSVLDEENISWTQVLLKNKRAGYILSSDMKSPLDYRFVFRKIKGKWVFSSFAAGD